MINVLNNFKKIKYIVRKHKKIFFSTLLLIATAITYLIIKMLKAYIYVYILDSGLGNQMYMYAYNYAFEKETGQKVLYDLTYFDYTKNKHEFNAIPKYFNIDLPLATKEDIKMALKHKPIIITKSIGCNRFALRQKHSLLVNLKKLHPMTFDFAHKHDIFAICFFLLKTTQKPSNLYI